MPARGAEGSTRGRILVVIAASLAFVAAFLPAGCSSSSAHYAGGGCEAFCTKWVNARCRRGPTKEACLAQCNAERAQCPTEANAMLRCATIEAQIACETGSGEPRVVGCAPRQASLASCIACDGFCGRYASSDCPATPTRDACVTTCLDRRCAREHAAVVTCAGARSPNACSPEGLPTFDGSRCDAPLEFAGFCVQRNGTALPFHWLPVVDETSDAGDGSVLGHM